MEAIVQQLMQEPLMLAVAILVIFALFISLMKKMIVLMSFCIVVIIGGLVYLDQTGQTPEQAMEEAKDYGNQALDKAKETIEDTKSTLEDKANTLKKTNETIEKAQKDSKKAKEVLNDKKKEK